MEKNVIKFSQADFPPSLSPSSSSCAVRTCDTNGCNAQVPFFHLRQTLSSSSPNPSSLPHLSTTLDDHSITEVHPTTVFSPTPATTSVTRISSSLIEKSSTTIPSSSSSASHREKIRFSIALVLTFLLQLSLVKDCYCRNTSFLCACTCVFLFLTFVIPPRN